MSVVELLRYDIKNVNPDSFQHFNERLFQSISDVAKKEMILIIKFEIRRIN